MVPWYVICAWYSKLPPSTDLCYRLTTKIDYSNTSMCERVLERAKQRASKWLSYRVSGAGSMVGQVGGVSAHKRPLLTLEPDYVLKPMQCDHRGLRELAFYEAINAASRKSGSKAYAAFTTVKATETPSLLDLVAFSLALLLKDPYIVSSERKILNAWAMVEKEAKLLERLYQFLPRYYGMVRHEKSSDTVEKEESNGAKYKYGIGMDCYLLLNDITVNFKKPNVIDLKMGSQTFEPDAPDEKKNREQSKYPNQGVFGFRVVGERVYQPSHKNAASDGFVFYPKKFGRSLASRQDLKDAFVTYFGLETIEPSLLGTRLKAITNVLLKLRSLQHWFRSNTSFRFCASSLLIAYEGDTSSRDTLDLVNVKMIDFGRVRRQSGGDPGYLRGLETISSLLEEISTDWQQKIPHR